MQTLPRVQRADLVVHDGTQAHDADVNVVFLADKPGVFQRPSAGQRVTTERNKKS